MENKGESDHFREILVNLEILEILAGWPRFGSVRLRFGGGRVRSVPVFGSGGSSTKRFFFSVFQYIFKGKDGSGSGSVPGKWFRGVSVLLSVLGKTVLTVPVSSSGSVLEPPCFRDSSR